MPSPVAPHWRLLPSCRGTSGLGMLTVPSSHWSLFPRLTSPAVSMHHPFPLRLTPSCLGSALRPRRKSNPVGSFITVCSCSGLMELGKVD